MFSIVRKHEIGDTMLICAIGFRLSSDTEAEAIWLFKAYTLTHHTALRVFQLNTLLSAI